MTGAKIGPGNRPGKRNVLVPPRKKLVAPEYARIPASGALLAFEAAARLGSFARAAEALSVSQSAVSHRVRELESQLDTALFRRVPDGLEVTEAGRRYLPHVRQAIGHLRAGADALASTRTDTSLTVSVSPNFATKWLVPRLGRFIEVHPDIDLRVSAALRHVDLGTDDVDVAVRHGNGDWPHLDVTQLCAESLFPVCSPALLDGKRLPCPPADLATMALLHDRNTEEWRHWLGVFGVDRVQRGRGPVFSDASLAIDAAVAGQGVALARSALVALDIAGGRLVRPCEESLPARFAYWIVCTRPAASLPKIVRFREWLLGQAAGDALVADSAAG